VNPGPRREVRLGGRDVERIDRPDGTTLVVNREPLAPYARAIPEFLVRYAAEAPERKFLAEEPPTAAPGGPSPIGKPLRRRARSVRRS
jgi:hypothetical protein